MKNGYEIVKDRKQIPGDKHFVFKIKVILQKLLEVMEI